MASWYTDFRERRGLGPKFDSAPATNQANQSLFQGPKNTYQPRGFPEAINADQFIPERFNEGEQDSGIANALETAMKAPAYTYERPIALADQLTGQKEGESLLDPISEGLRSLPGIGQPLDQAGKVAENVFDATYNEFNLVAQPMNSHLAWLWDSTKDDEEDQGIGLFAELNAVLRGKANPFEVLNPFDAVTKEELRERMNDIGWTNEELRQIETGEKGWMDFSHKTLDFGFLPDQLNAVADFAARAVGDPLNFVFMPGSLISKANKLIQLPKALGKVNAAEKAGRTVGIAGATGPALRAQPALSSATAAALKGAPVVGDVTKVARGVTGVKSAVKSRVLGDTVSRTYGARVRHAAQVSSKMMTAHKAGTKAAQKAALANGSARGVTLSGLADDMMTTAGRGFRGYRNVAIGTTAAQVGLNIGEELDIAPGVMGDVYDVAAKMGERKPLSNNDLFVLTSLMHFPARTIAGKVWDNTAKRAVKAGRKFDQQNEMLRWLEPEAFVKDKAGRYVNGGAKEAYRRAAEKVGGEENLKAMFMQVLKTALKDRHIAEGNRLLPDVFATETLLEAGYSTNRYNRLLNRMLRTSLEEGAVSAKDIRYSMETMTRGRGGVLDDAAEGLANANATRDDFYKVWNEWEPQARRYSEIFENGSAITPGITSDLVIEEDMMWAINELKVAAKGGETITAEELLDILRVNPAVFKAKEAEAFQRALVPSGRNGSFKVSEVEDILTQIQEKHGVSRQDFFAHAHEWENLGRQFELDRVRASNGNAAGSKADLGSDRSTVVFDTPGDVAKASAMAGLEGRVVENARAMRAQPDVIKNMTNIPTGLRMAGFKVLSAVDGIALAATRGATTGVPSIAMRFDPARPLKDIVEAAAIALNKSAGKRATVVLRGDSMIASKGLAANGTEYVYDISRMKAQEVNDLADWLQGFGDRVHIDQTAKRVEIIVPNGKASLERKLGQAEQRMGAPATEPVHFRDIVKGKKTHDIPNGRYSLDLVIADAKRNRRYYAADGYIERGAAGIRSGETKAQQAVAQRATAAARGASADGTTRPGSQLTRYEVRMGRGARGRTKEFLVGKRNARQTEALTKRIRDAGIRNNASEPFSIREGDTLFGVTTDGSLPTGGVIVRANGEFIPWRLHPDRAAPASWEDTLAEAAEYATWTRVAEPDLASGVTDIDRLAEHGFFPAFRGRVIGADDAEDMIYLLRDPDHVASVHFGKNAYIDEVRGSENIITMTPEQARVNTEALASTLYPERAARARQAVRDAEMLNKERRLAEKNAEIIALQNHLDGRAAARSRPHKQTDTSRRSDMTTRNADEVAGPYQSKTNENAVFVQVDRPSTGPQNYKLHVSSNPADAERTLEIVANIADDSGVTYKWVKSKAELASSDGFGLGATQQGKFITLYPDDAVARQVAERIDSALAAEGLGRTAPTVPGEARFAADSPVFYRAEGNQFRGALGGGVPPNNPIGTRGQARSANYRTSSRYRAAIAERDALEASLSTRAAVKRRQQITDAVVPEGQVRFVAGAEDDVAKFKPNLDESINGRLDEMSDIEKVKLYALEKELRESGSMVTPDGRVVNATQYQSKLVPRGGTPYYYGQNEAYDTLMKGKQAADTWFRSNVTNKATQAVDLLFHPVYAGRLAEETGQALQNELITAGATKAEVKRFMNALQADWEDGMNILGAKIYRSPTKVGVGTINKIARGDRRANQLFSGFSAEVIANVGDFGSLVHRSQSRVYRNLAKKYPAKSGQGSLGGLIEQAYGKGAGGRTGAVTAGIRKGSWAANTTYNVLRFITDPRWYLMNLFEADFLGMARYGVKVRGIFGGKARGGMLDAMTGKSPGVAVNPGMERMASRGENTALLSVEEILKADRGAAGWVDPRALYGYASEAFNATKKGVTDDFIKKIWDEGSPVIDDLKARYGDDTTRVVQEMDDLLFSIDNKGAKRAITEDIAARELLEEGVPAYDEFIEGLWKAHEKNYKDIIHTFHGNVNRGNLERLLNSPLLWWPLSYQIKTGKWMIDVMTKGFMGNKAELAGSAVLYKLLQNHKSAMEDNEEYRKSFEEHPALYQALSMMLPMTPFDMGVFMARWTRYSGSWIGAQLGVWDQDPSYPQDPYNFAIRSLALGPIYSADLLGDILSEGPSDEPGELLGNTVGERE